jgi:hypothetical protein
MSGTPLSGDERRRAKRFRACYTVWHQDRRSHEAPARPVRYYLAREPADADADANNQRLGDDSWEVYEVTGPRSLIDDIDRGLLTPDAARQVLASLEAPQGTPEAPASMPRNAPDDVT